ncbi:MAG: metallophosphoesterase family protein [Halothiobacillaceae bacterium]
MIRVALVADTHGALDERIAEIVASCDLAVHAGDIGSPRVLAALQPKSGRVLAVRGNNDTPLQWPCGSEGWLCELPGQVAIDLPGGILAIEHGHRALPAALRHARLRERHPDARAVVYGHTHRLVVDQGAKPWVLNPGAAGRIRTHGAPSCLVLNAGVDQWSVDIHTFRR